MTDVVLEVRTPAVQPSPRRRAWNRFRANRAAVFGLLLMLALVAMSLVGSEAEAVRLDLRALDEPPSAAHPLGTDSLGRDILARTLVGGRVTLLVAVVSVAVALLIGGAIGALAGYYRRLDSPIMRVVDVVMSFPAVLLLLIAAALLGPSLVTVMIMLGLITWTVPCRIFRGQFLALRDTEYVVAARTIGLRDRTIVWRHIVPNALAPLVVFVTLGIAAAVIAEASLSYLGLGVQPPTPSWGNMLNAARSVTVLSERPWQWVPPAVCVIAFVLAVNFVGDGIRDALDSRATRSGGGR